MNDLPLRIVAINMYEAPAYQEQYYRPFTTHVNDQSIVDEIREQTHAGANMNAGLVSNAAARLIRPQTNVAGPAFIENGWNERRFVFTIQVECESGFQGHTVTQYISGYTNYIGVNPSTQSVDPQMRFFFNSVMSFRSFLQQLPGRGMTANRALQHAAHVITPNSHLMRTPAPLNHGYPQGGSFDDIDHLLRPQDLVNTWQTQHVLGHAMGNNINGADVIDMSTSAAGSLSLSRFNNGHTPEYLSRILGAMFNVQSQLEHHHVSDNEHWSALLGTVQEPSMHEFNILKEFVNNMGYCTYGGENSVTWGDLVSSFGEFTDFDNITRVYFTGELMRSNPNALHFGAENTEAMGGANNEVIMANMVVNSLPGILSRCMLAEFAFTATNEVVGSPEPYAVVPTGQPQTIAQGANYQQLVHIALTSIKNEVCPMISNGNTIPFFIQVHASLIRDTTVVVRIADGPETPFTIPTWGSAIFTPIAHSTQDNLKQMAHDIDSVYDRVSGHQHQPQDIWAPEDSYAAHSAYDSYTSVSTAEPPAPDGSIVPPHELD